MADTGSYSYGIAYCDIPELQRTCMSFLTEVIADSDDSRYLHINCIGI